MTGMPPLKQEQKVIADEAQTQALTQRLAGSPALNQAVIWLQGHLGAGKTTFVRHLLRTLGVQGRIKSPTYAIVEPHQVPASALFPLGLSVSHFDFYRFNDPREWEDAGFRELFAAPGLKLVEWPEKAANHLPPPDLDISIEALQDDQRLFELKAFSPTGLKLMNELAA